MQPSISVLPLTLNNGIKAATLTYFLIFCQCLIEIASAQYEVSSGGYGGNEGGNGGYSYGGAERPRVNLGISLKVPAMKINLGRMNMPKISIRAKIKQNHGPRVINVPEMHIDTNSKLPAPEGSQAEAGHGGYGSGSTSGDYNSQPSGYSSPSSGYESHSSGYNSQPTGYSSPSSGYNAPSSGYSSPSSGYESHSSGYNSQPTGYNSPTSEYHASSSGYNSQPSGYSSGPSGYDQASSTGNSYGGNTGGFSVSVGNRQQYGENHGSSSGYGQTSSAGNSGYMPLDPGTTMISSSNDNYSGDNKISINSYPEKQNHYQPEPSYPRQATSSYSNRGASGADNGGYMYQNKPASYNQQPQQQVTYDDTINYAATASSQQGNYGARTNKAIQNNYRSEGGRRY